MMFFTVDGVGLVVGLLLQAALIATMIRKRLARNYPVFLIYLLLNLIEDLLGLYLQGGPHYSRFYFIVTILDYVLQVLIVLEVGWNVLRPSRRALPLPILPIATIALLICAIVAASLSPGVESAGLGHLEQISLRMTLGLAIMKLLVFVVLAGFAHVLGVGWKNHVLQFATGLAFYAAVSLPIQISSDHISAPDRPSHVAHLARLAQIQSLAYNVTLVFWTWAFSRNEAPRKEFTPQMQQVLVTIAQSAKRTRLAVTRSTDQR